MKLCSQPLYYLNIAQAAGEHRQYFTCKNYEMHEGICLPCNSPRSGCLAELLRHQMPEIQRKYQFTDADVLYSTLKFMFTPIIYILQGMYFFTKSSTVGTFLIHFLQFWKRIKKFGEMQKFGEILITKLTIKVEKIPAWRADKPCRGC
jgi:hypothetical protein